MKEEYTSVKHIRLLRLISNFFPLKSKLNFLIRKYINFDRKLAIPYFNQYSIIINPKMVAPATLNHLIYEGHKYLPEYYLIKKVKSHLGNEFTMVDVGANIGTLIWQFANYCKKIYCFEPVPRLNEVIVDSSVYNKIDNLTVISKAVGDVNGVINMIDNDNSHVLKEGVTISNSIVVEITTLDEALKEVKQIDLIKIDVEGFEWHVLQGSKQIIKKNKPIIILELHPVFLKNYGIDYNKILDFLECEGYIIEYYSFLLETRMNKIFRLLSRYLPNTGTKFKNREMFAKDIPKLPPVLSYHLYCKHS